MKRKMTPLEIAEQRQKQRKKCPPCSECHNSKKIDNVLYCKVDGKIILPRFYNACCCHGEKLNGETVNTKARVV